MPWLSAWLPAYSAATMSGIQIRVKGQPIRLLNISDELMRFNVASEAVDVKLALLRSNLLRDSAVAIDGMLVE